MTTTKNTKGQETLNKNFENMLNWFQDASIEMIESQSNQLKVANEMFSKTLNNYFDGIKKSDFTGSYNMPKEMIEMMQKNTKDFVSNSNAALKKMMDFGQQQNSSFFSTDFLNKISETFNKQMESITEANKNYFDNFSKQVDTSTYSPSYDKLKTAFETNFKSSKKTMQDIVDSYSKQNHPTIEANKKVLDDLNKNMTTMAENNFKLWSELFNKTTKPNTEKESSNNNPNFHGNGKAKMPETI